LASQFPLQWDSPPKSSTLLFWTPYDQTPQPPLQQHQCNVQPQAHNLPSAVLHHQISSPHWTLCWGCRGLCRETLGWKKLGRVGRWGNGVWCKVVRWQQGSEPLFWNLDAIQCRAQPPSCGGCMALEDGIWSMKKPLLDMRWPWLWSHACEWLLYTGILIFFDCAVSQCRFPFLV